MDAVVFDLGRVLLDWDPRYYYRPFFANEETLEDFVQRVIAHEWYLEMDAGKPSGREGGFRIPFLVRGCNRLRRARNRETRSAHFRTGDLALPSGSGEDGVHR